MQDRRRDPRVPKVEDMKVESCLSASLSAFLSEEKGNDEIGLRWQKIEINLRNTCSVLLHCYVLCCNFKIIKILNFFKIPTLLCIETSVELFIHTFGYNWSFSLDGKVLLLLKWKSHKKIITDYIASLMLCQYTDNLVSLMSCQYKFIHKIYAHEPLIHVYMYTYTHLFMCILN